MDDEYPVCGNYLSFLRNQWHTDGRLLPSQCAFCHILFRALAAEVGSRASFGRTHAQQAGASYAAAMYSGRGPGDLLDRGPDGEWFVHIKPAQSR